eukprot:CAMPEP_0114320872 /NCGR_PEP_ID=MMETSP0059-20121206/26217_1 /TAXON_ID=36894 /ORGANISM="Pyramimonas parkeae, Strain CCMP726" /LENGTH=421 /DNA_ID=CAMNT_0001448397 /DNA_START=538 /DNA_END=1803 /DNA_ORIENTATION=+
MNERSLSLSTTRVKDVNQTAGECAQSAHNPTELTELLATNLDEVLTSSRLGLGPSMTSKIVLVGLTGLYTILMFLAGKMSNAYWREPVQVDEHGKYAMSLEQLVHFGSLVAFSVTFTMCMVDYAWTRSVVKKKVALCVCFINGIAAITYWFFFCFGMPRIRANGGSELTDLCPLRYLQWIFTTPAMIIVISCLVRKNEISKKLLGEALISDLIMIVAGFWEKYLGSPWHEFFFAVSLVAFVITQMHFKVLLDLGASVLVNKMDRLKFRILSWYTLMVWSLFPMVRVMSMFGLLRDETEEVLNALLDLAAKLVYAVSLMVLNFTVIDQLVEERLERAHNYIKNELARTTERDTQVIMSVSDMYEKKMLAYKEAASWRRQRELAMLNDGFPVHRVTALLDSTLSEYVALSSGNISAYMHSHDE